MEEKNDEKPIVITPKIAKIIEAQLDKCIRKKKVPSKRLLDTIETLRHLNN